MSNLEQHKQALFCNDSKSITDYETAMHNAVQAVSSWLKNEKMYTGGLWWTASNRPKKA